MSYRGRVFRTQRGQSIVEFALLAPAFFLCLLGTIDLGRAVYTYVVLSNAVREGCRVAIVQTNSNEAIRQAVINAAVAVNLTPADVIIQGTRAPGTAVTVRATNTYRPVTPVISQLVGTALQLSAQSTMVVD